MIAIVPYQCDRPAQFAQLGRTIRAALQEQALCIDHIGSTSVPGLAAKDIPPCSRRRPNPRGDRGPR